MAEIENVDGVIQKSLADIGENFKRRVNCTQIFYRWEDFVGDDCEEIFPVELNGKTLTLYTSNPALADKFKFLLPKLIEKINAAFDDEVVTKIIFGRNFQTEPKKVASKEIPVDEEIVLTNEEIAECRKISDKLTSDDAREMTFNLLVARKKADAWRKNHGWHKCAVCENLCPPEENLCNLCEIHEPAKMLKAIREIFLSAPYTKFHDVREKIFRLMPHMKSHCTLSVIESARMDLIQQTARRVSFGDKESSAAKFLVMLIRQLPEESLTEKIIEKTLYEFRFDLADRPAIQPQTFKKFSGR